MPLAPSTLHGLQILSERKARDFFKISEFSSVKQYVLENQAVPTTFGPPWMSLLNCSFLVCLQRRNRSRRQWRP